MSSPSHFTDERDYVITGEDDLGERRRTIHFVWKTGVRSSITIDVAWDSPEMRDKLIRAWAELPRIHGDTVKRNPIGS